MVVDVLDVMVDAVGLSSCFSFSAVATATASAALAIAAAAMMVKADAVLSSGSSFFCAAAEMVASKRAVSLLLCEMIGLPSAGSFHRAAA